MKRRTCLKAMLAVAGGSVIPALADSQAGGERPIQLHADLAVDPAKEQQMLRFFQEKFRPAAAQQPGLYRYAHVETEVRRCVVHRRPEPTTSSF